MGDPASQEVDLPELLSRLLFGRTDMECVVFEALHFSACVIGIDPHEFVETLSDGIGGHLAASGIDGRVAAHAADSVASPFEFAQTVFAAGIDGPADRHEDDTTSGWGHVGYFGATGFLALSRRAFSSSRYSVTFFRTALWEFCCSGVRFLGL